MLADGWKVRGLTRDATSGKAQALAAAGAEVVTADLTDHSSLEPALAGAYGVFSVQNFWLPEVGFAGEVRQGKNLADAAKAAGVQHFVYSSVGAAHRGMGQAHFASKWEIEQHLHSLDLPYTIVRPVAFMDNYSWQRAGITNGTFTGWNLRPDKGLQLVAVEDIGGFVALVLANRSDYLGKTIELAGDELTETQVAETLGRVLGRTVRLAQQQMPQTFTPTPEQIAMFTFFSAQGYDADIPALRKVYPQLLTFEQYLRRNGWENQPPLPMPAEQPAWG